MYTWPDKATIVNRALLSLLGGSLQIALTVPYLYLLVFIIGINHQFSSLFYRINHKGWDSKDNPKL